MTKTAFVFPGQGSQSVGMLADLSDHFSIVGELFNRASAVLNFDLWALVQTDPAGTLNQTAFTQPAMLVADVAVYACYQSLGGKQPDYMAGHSLGELAALVCAQSIEFEDAVALVRKRGELMQSAVADDQGAMAAIIGLSNELVQSLCDQAQEHGVVSPANFNSIGQVVVAGERIAVDTLIELAKSAGAKIAKRLPVSVPSHCPLMQPATQPFLNQLKSITIQPPSIPVVHNADVSLHSDPDEIRGVLVKQLVQPVRWVETIEYLMSHGCQHVIECGPGKVLTGLNKRISKALTVLNVQTTEALHSLVEEQS